MLSSIGDFVALTIGWALIAVGPADPMATHRVEPGQRYRDVRIGVYGQSADAEWIVETLRADALGVRHAQLVNAADRTERKTLSAAVLVDPSRFEEV